jgi:hypothetical protein
VYFRKENGNITGNKIEDRISFVRKFSILKFMMQRAILLFNLLTQMGDLSGPFDKLFQLYLRKKFETLRIPGNRTPSSVLKFKSSNSLTNGAISSTHFGTSFPKFQHPKQNQFLFAQNQESNRVYRHLRVIYH